MSTEADPVERDDRWILNLRGWGVAGITVDYRLPLAFDEGWEVVLKGPARLSSGPPHTSPGVLLVPETQDVAAALSLFGTKVVSAVAFKSGTLRMVFEDGRHLTCPADAAFEAWQVTGPGGWRFVSLPGGGLGVWSAAAANENAHGEQEGRQPLRQRERRLRSCPRSPAASPSDLTRASVEEIAPGETGHGHGRRADHHAGEPHLPASVEPGG